jgi:hypothetical protein
MGLTIRQLETPLGAANLTGAPLERECRRHLRGPQPSQGGSELRGGFRAIGVAVSQLARPIVAKRGGGVLVRLKAEWAAIVGPEWAKVSWPNALGRDGGLKLRVASTAALELQHRTPLMIERINLFFGRPVITRLALVQGPLPLPPAPTGEPARPLAPAVEKAIDDRISGVADPELRDALARLGRAVARGS